MSELDNYLFNYFYLPFPCSLWLLSLAHSPPVPFLSPAPHLPRRDARTSVAGATAGPAERSGLEGEGSLNKVEDERWIITQLVI